MSVPRTLRCGITNHTTFYSYRVLDGPCAELESPTISNLYDDLCSTHDDECDCGIAIRLRAWKVCNDPLTPGGSTLDIDTSVLHEYDKDTPLSEFFDHVTANRGSFHLFFEGVPSNIPKDPYASSEVFSHDSHHVRRTAGGKERLAMDTDITYDLMCETPGMLVVDKSRRPAGFGKTTFLSMFETWFDIKRGSFSGWFPSVYHPAGHTMEQSYYCRNTSSLICHLDLSELDLSQDMSESALRDSCRAFMNSAAKVCFRRNRDVIQYPDVVLDLRFPQRLEIIIPHSLTGEERVEWLIEQLTFDQFLWIVSTNKYPYSSRIFLGIDNYTDPLIKFGRGVESVLATEIFEPIIRGIRSREIYRAFAVGTDVPGIPFMPYCVTRYIYQHTRDLSQAYQVQDALGITPEEIIALGKALFGDSLSLLDLVRKHDSSPDIGWSRTYAYREVLALCRVLQSSEQATVPPSLAIRSIDFENHLPDDLQQTVPFEFRKSQDEQSSEFGDIIPDIETPIPTSCQISPRSSMKRKAREDIDRVSDRADDIPSTPPIPLSDIEPFWHSRIGASLRVPPSPSTTSSLSSLETKVGTVSGKRQKRKPRLSDPKSEASSLDSVSTLSVDSLDGSPPLSLANSRSPSPLPQS